MEVTNGTPNILEITDAKSNRSTILIENLLTSDTIVVFLLKEHEQTKNQVM